MKIYDKHGFNEDGVHRDTGTRYDLFGFNKNGTTHKDTQTSKDKFGKKREYYLKDGICSYFILILRKLFVNLDNFNFNGKKFIDVGVNYNEVSKLELNSFNVKTRSNYTDYRPTKLDGSPDYRYKSRGKLYTKDITSYEIIYHTKELNKNISFSYRFSGKISEKKVIKAIKRFNILLAQSESSKICTLYNDFLSLKEKCQLKRKETLHLNQKKIEKLDIYNKLIGYRERFTKEQYQKFEKLKREIQDIENGIMNEREFKYAFDDIYIKLNSELIVAEIDSEKIEKDNNNKDISKEISKLFQQLK